MENIVTKESTYWKRIKANIKKQYEEGKITKKYSYNSFCNNFIAEEQELEIAETNECLCDHEIIRNYKYKHKERGDYFILGSCCIKKFSVEYYKKIQCKECNEKIKPNKYNICSKCRIEKEYENRCKCKKCGYIKNDDKYKYCYKCKFGQVLYIKCSSCGIDKKSDTYKRCYKCNCKHRK